MASLQKTYSGDLSTSIAKQLWIARNIAAAAKEDAVKVAKGYGVDPMLRPGEFLGHALGARATGWLPKRFQHQVPNVTMGNPSYIARGQSSTALYGQSSPINARSAIVPSPGGSLAATGPRLSAGQIARLDPVAKARMIQERMGLPVVSAESGFIPNKMGDIFGLRGTRKEIQVKEGKLGKFLEAVALSLSSSFNSINKKLDESSEGINATKDGIDTTYKKLEQHSDSLESKLDDIIEALRASNKQKEEKRDRREAETKIQQQKETVDLSNSNRILMQDMDRQEIRDLQQENIQDQVRDDQAGAQLELPINEGEDGEGFARGGIASGPDSGYLAVLHGDEAVVPLDNNFTQGQPSAVGDQPVSQMPMMAERGIPAGDNSPSMKPSFTPSVNVTTPIVGSGASSDPAALSKAIQLPTKAAGLVTMGIMGNVMKHAMLPPGVVKHMKTLSAPIAQAFGVPDLMASDLTEQSEEEYAENKKRQEVLDAKRGREGREKGILGRIKDFLFGTGGGNISYRGGTGGNTYVNNRSTGTGGGYGVGGGIFGGGKPSDAIKELRYRSDHPLGTAQPNPFKPGSTLYKNFEKLRQYDMMGMEISSTGGDSEFFTKNVSYENAFDYNKFNSPQYGLKTSEIAYNMSMQDEVNNMIEGLSDPDSQVILNNHTAKTNTGKQIDHSAIAVRGNPLKEGTYLSPYSV